MDKSTVEIYSKKYCGKDEYGKPRNTDAFANVLVQSLTGILKEPIYNEDEDQYYCPVCDGKVNMTSFPGTSEAIMVCEDCNYQYVF